VMRTTLLPGLLQNLSRAIRHQVESVRLYEMGRAYLPDPKGGVQHHPVASEPLRLAGVLWGKRDGRTWNAPDVPMDFFDAKGAVEAVVEALAVEGVRFVPADAVACHPRACAELRLASGALAGRVGELHPRVVKAFDVPRGVFVFEVDLVPLYTAAGLRRTYRPLPRHPAVLRDLAVLVSLEVSVEEVRGAIREAGGAWVEEVVVFDQYTGNPVPEGKKNLAFALRYRDPERTLNDAEVAQVHDQIVKTVNHRFGASLRGASN
jgi:phenylalanyl-tRNA synthetase beta chain